MLCTYIYVLCFQRSREKFDRIPSIDETAVVSHGRNAGSMTSNATDNQMVDSTNSNDVHESGRGFATSANGSTRRSMLGRQSILNRSNSISKNFQFSSEDLSATNVVVQDTEDSWDATDTHHMLPIFAAARAYVAASFESLLVQSFYSVLTPVICEKLVCGQDFQMVMQIDVPSYLVGKRFLDAFRLLSLFHVRCMGIYRAPNDELKALLPYTFISPQVLYFR